MAVPRATLPRQRPTVPLPASMTASSDDATIIRDSRCWCCHGEYARARLDGNQVVDRHWRHDRGCLFRPAAPALPAWVRTPMRAT